MQNTLKKIILGFSCLVSCAYAYAEVPMHFDAAIKGGNNRNLVQMGMFAPIHQNENGVVLGDIRAMRHLPHNKNKDKSIYSKDTYEINLGLGYRYILSDYYDEESVLGSFVYYDMRRARFANKLLSQVTLNLHYLTSTWQATTNVYIPAGKTKVTTTNTVFDNTAIAKDLDIFFVFNDQTITEKSMSGVDLRLSRNIPGMDNVRLGILGYHFKGNKSINGGGAELNWEVNEYVSLEASYTYDKTRKNNFLGGIRINLPVTGSTATKRPIDALLSKRVERDIDIITDSLVTSTSREELQKDKLAIHPDMLKNIDNPDNADENVLKISRLAEAQNDDNVELLLLDEGSSADNVKVNLKKVKRIKSKEFRAKVEESKKKARQQLDENKTIAAVVNEAANAANTEDRIVGVLAAEEALQDKNEDQDLIYAGGKQRSSYEQTLQKLYKQYAKANSTKAKVYTTNLPGYGNVEVGRAGAIILVKEGGKHYAIMGVDKNNENINAPRQLLGYSTWPTGELELRDGSLQTGLIREVFEETGARVALSKTDLDNAIKDGRFFYDKDSKILTIIHPDKKGKISLTDIERSAKKLKNDPSVAKSFKEISKYHLASVDELKKLEQNIAQASPTVLKDHHDAAYKILDNQGKDLRIEFHYAQAFGKNKGMKAINEALKGF